MTARNRDFFVAHIGMGMCLTLLGCAASGGGDNGGAGSDFSNGGAGGSREEVGGANAGGSDDAVSGGNSGMGGSAAAGNNATGGASTGGASTGGASAIDSPCQWIPVDAKHKAFYMASAPNTNAVYMYDAGLYVTTNNGADWIPLAKRATDGKLFNAGLLKIVFDPADPTDNTFWAAGIYGASGAYFTTDGGKTVSSTCFAHSQTIAVDFSDPDRKTLLTTDHGGGFFMSTDGGKTCTSILGKLQAADPKITRANVPYIIDTKTFLVGTGGWNGTFGTFRSTDGGNTWTKVHVRAPSQNLIVAPDGLYIYDLFWNLGLMTSADKGVTWTTQVGPGTVETGLESVTGTFIGDGRYVNVKTLTKSGDQQLLITSDYKTWTKFLPPFPTERIGDPDATVGVVYNKTGNNVYTFSRYGKISRCDL